MKIRMHFKTLGIRVSNKVFGYDPETMTLGIRYTFERLKSPKGWLFQGVPMTEWEKFQNDPEASSRLSYWFERFKIVEFEAEITFMGSRAA